MKTKEKLNTGRNHIAIVAHFRANAGAHVVKDMDEDFDHKNTRDYLEDYQEYQQIQQDLYSNDYYEDDDGQEVRYHFGSEVKNTPKLIKK